jgi:hypothetical protein
MKIASRQTIAAQQKKMLFICSALKIIFSQHVYAVEILHVLICEIEATQAVYG